MVECRVRHAEFSALPTFGEARHDDAKERIEPITGVGGDVFDDIADDFLQGVDPQDEYNLENDVGEVSCTQSIPVTNDVADDPKKRIIGRLSYYHTPGMPRWVESLISNL